MWRTLGYPGPFLGPSLLMNLTLASHVPSNSRYLPSICNGSHRPTGIYRGGPWACVLEPYQAAAQNTDVYWGLPICLLGGVKLRGLHAPSKPDFKEEFTEGRNWPPLSGRLLGLVSLVYHHLHAQRRIACWAGSFRTTPFFPSPQPLPTKGISSIIPKPDSPL